MKVISKDKKKPRIYEHQDLISLLLKLRTKEKRAKLIGLLNREQINTICEIFFNFLSQNLTTDNKVLNKLRKFKSLIRKVGAKSTGIKIKRALLGSKKGGGVLSILLPIAASFIGSLIK